MDMPLAPDDRIAKLERENAKLRKINKVLMDRVERSMDYQGNAFSLFQTAIVLESKVRERTMALEDALQALTAAKEETETAKSRLAEAIATITEGFLLCDAEDRLVLHNARYTELWPGMKGHIRSGMRFEDILRRAIETGEVLDAQADPDGWLRARMAYHNAPGKPVVLQFRDGRWLKISERTTRDGGVVGIYTDITEIKLVEIRRRERELAEKSRLLQATLDNLAQGVSVFDGNHRLVAWNDRFVELLRLPPGLARPGTPLAEFGALLGPGDAGAFPASLEEEIPCGESHEREFPCGEVLEIYRNAMPDGGFVATYTDITQRKRAEEALRDSERRIRLVTDAMPALIAYVDADERYRFTNKAYEDWFGRPRAEIDGRLMSEVLAQGLYDKRHDYVAVALSGRECTFEMDLPTEIHRIEHALATYVPHFAGNGEVVGFFALIQDITERKKAAAALLEAKETLERRVQARTAELMTAKAEAEQANLSKTKFLAAASHDLLQPLNAARVFVAALSERRMAPRNRGLVDNITAALEGVDELLTALLDISKLDAGVLYSEVTDFPIDILLGNMGAEHVMLAREKGLDLKTVACAATVRSDMRLLGRILRNFISNAIRYTPEGRILLGCRKHGDKLLIGVWDTGIGVPEDKLKVIFEEFRRLNMPQDRNMRERAMRDRGMGLGLAIVERIARKLDHTIVVRSELGKGSLFGIEVPLGQPGAVEAAPPPAPVIRSDSLPGSFLVVIDNERSILAGMAALLEGWGCATLTATSGQDALAQLARADRRPDLIIADYHLDDDQIGIDAIRQVQARTGPLPALVITADRTAEVQQAIRDAGFHLLTKPVKPARLRSLLAHVLGSRTRVEAMAD